MLWQISFYGAGGHCKSNFYPFSGVTAELKAFLHDISQANLKVIQDDKLLCALSRFASNINHKHGSLHI